MNTLCVSRFLVRTVFRWALVAIFGALLTSPASAAEREAPVCVMSYNLRYASSTPPNAWPDRHPIMVECIRNVSPDLIGTQEGVYEQLKDLAGSLPEYEWIGLGRDGGSKGEFMAIMYRKTRFEPKAYDHFWLSDTPNVIASTTWGNSNRRMVTWVRFHDRETNREFYLFNTHFDHQIQAAREKSAELLRKKIEDLNTTLPVIVTGDFNADARNKAYQTLVESGFLKDTWRMAGQRIGEGLATYNGFKEIVRNDARIDWILLRGDADVPKTEIVTFAKEGKFPSDHFPVVAWIKLKD